MLKLFSLCSTLLMFSVFAQEKHVWVTPSILKAQSKNYLAIHFKNQKSWHTYWKNPGDSGLPIENTFKKWNSHTRKFEAISKDILKAVEWPAPYTYKESDEIWTYGYKKEFAIFYEIPNSWLTNTRLNLKITYLVCKQICIPGKEDIEFNINNGIIKNQKNHSELIKIFNHLPTEVNCPSDFQMYLNLSPDNKNLILSYRLSRKALKLNPKKNLITPFTLAPFTFRHEQLYSDNDGGIFGTMDIEWDGEYQEPEVPLPSNGVFKIPYKLKFLFQDPTTGKTLVIHKSFKNFSTNTTFIPSYIKKLTTLSLEQPKETKLSLKQILLYILFAILGGLILNVMPCVLPVISIKLFGLIKHKESSKKEILLHNLSYTFGVLFTFSILGLLVILLQKGGHEIGWGFQMQSPIFVGLMVLMIFIFALNLFGLFEFGTPGGKLLGKVQLSNNLVGSFLNGIFCTILATPCSAPFLGTALTFALTSSPIVIMSMFWLIGLGLSLPFIIIGLYPPALKILPRPGMWMEHVKKILGLSLLLTIVWLNSVMDAQIDNPLTTIYFDLTIVLSFFALYVIFKMNIKSKAKWLICILPIICLAFFLNNNSTFTPSTSKTDNKIMALDTNWSGWSTKRLETGKAKKELIFMDFTAKWCLTCIVNKKAFLERKPFLELVKKYNVTLLRADWTKRNPNITKWLKNYNIVGVPAYFIQEKDGSIHSLGETINLVKIEEVLSGMFK